MPHSQHFGPLDKKCGKRPKIEMTVDEFETIRLIDWEGLNQEECAAQMAVARTTVQAIYIAARKKLAQCLVEGKELSICGGDYILCVGDSASGCGCAHCRKKICSGDDDNE